MLVKLFRWSSTYKIIVLFLAIGSSSVVGNSQSPPAQSGASTGVENASDLLTKVERLVQQNRQLELQTHKLETQNQELMDQIESLRQTLAKQAGVSIQTSENPTEPEAELPAMSDSQEGVEPAPSPELAVAQENKTWGTYTPNFGFKVADTEYGDMNLSMFAYVRYLNQKDLARTFIDSFGNLKLVQQRQDFQLAKVQAKFLGWILDPKLRYFLYVWTSNANMGQGAQVVVAGNLNYTINKHITFSAGVNGLPGTRTLEGNFPYWLSEDSRLIADEFFRPSYTSGIWARGLITDKLRYHVMAGNNLSQLGVNAGQLPNYLRTYSAALVWMPSTGEFGSGFGDFESHDKVATRLGFHYTTSHENKQSQPDTEAFQNTQLRISDGNIIFNPNLFGPGITITDATYNMTSYDGGIKYQGYALEGEYYVRWLNNFKGIATAGLHGLFDHGFQLQLSTMLVPKTFQLYAGGSAIFGQFGTPWDTRIGVNWFPFKNRVVRWNNEGLYVSKSPVGYSAAPYAVGSKGWVFHSNWEVAF